MIRATPRTYSRSNACAASFVRRGCQLMKYGKALSSQGGLIIRKPPFVSAILAKVRGTARTRSVCAMAKTAGIKNGILTSIRRFTPGAAKADPPWFDDHRRPGSSRAVAADTALA